MSRWYRSYADQHRNPKVIALSDKDYRLWHQLLGVAAENDGLIPPISILKSLVTVRYDRLNHALKSLLAAELIDTYEDGYKPRNWDKRQYKSDTSTARVQKHRAAGNVSETPPDTETDNIVSEPKGSSTAARYAFEGRTIKLNAKDFENWRSTYHGIPDMKAELTSIDAWFQGRPVVERKRWFHSVPGMLGRKHQEALKPKADHLAYRNEPLRV